MNGSTDDGAGVGADGVDDAAAADSTTIGADADDGAATDGDNAAADEVLLDELATVAERAARAGGGFLEGKFRDGPVEGDYGVDDVKAAADRVAEERVLSVVRRAFPGHALHAEESGRNGDGDGRYEWVVDPLDGTNNFASGLPAFATAVAVVRDGDPVVSAIYEPLPDELYLAVEGGGATVNGDPLVSGSDVPLEAGSVSFVRGLPAVRDDDLRARGDDINRAIRDRCKRVVSTWSPCVDWGLLARGSLEGIVCFHPDVYEQYAGELLAREAGVASYSTDHLYVGAGDEATLDALRDAVEGA